MSKMLSDGSFYDLIMDIRVKDKGLFATIKRFFQKMIAKFTKEYANLTPDQQDAQDIRQMKDMFDKLQKAFAEALVEASDNFQAAQNSTETIENSDGDRYSSRYEKRFFPGNVFPSGQTHTAVTEWAKRKDAKTGDRRLVLYKGAYYQVGKFDDMDFGYLITKKYNEYDYKEELKEYGQIDIKESYEKRFINRIARYRETAEHRQRGYHADSSGNEYRGENRSVYGVDFVQDGQRRTAGEIERDRSSSLRDQREIGRESLEWSPQEIYDKILELDRKLVFAEGRYATKLKNQRERYANMIDEMKGWDRVKLSERGEGSSNRSLLANAFEGLSKSSVEYKMIQDYKEQVKVLDLLDKQLSDLNAQIHEIRFTKGKYDAKKLLTLEEKAERIARDINKQDKVLIRMEASEPLRKIIEFERKKASQKTKEHIAEIQQNKKLRAEQAENAIDNYHKRK